MRLCQFSLATVAVLFIIAAPALATELGDPAPPLKVKEWVKGKPVDLKAGKGKNIYVIEFWATWCGPCIKGMPHLTELQKKYKDKGVVIVSISSADKNLETVRKFVKARGDEMGYTVAYEDRSERHTSNAYMKAFNQNGIPHAFVIDKEGRIAWHGHPIRMDKPLEEIVAGTFDLEKAKKEDAEAQVILKNRATVRELMKSYFEVVGSSEGADKSKAIAKKLIPLIEKDAPSLNALSWGILDNDDVEYRDLELALRAAKIAVKLTEEKDAAILDTYARALWDTGEKEKALEYQRKAVRVCDNDSMKAELEKVLEEYERELDK